MSMATCLSCIATYVKTFLLKIKFLISVIHYCTCKHIKVKTYISSNPYIHVSHVYLFTSCTAVVHVNPVNTTFVVNYICKHYLYVP